MSLYSEQSVLGILLTHPEKIADAAALTPEDFEAPAHRILYRNLVEQIRENRPSDPVSLADVLEAKNLLVKVGGLRYLTDLVAECGYNPDGFPNYVKSVRESARRRRLLATGQEIARMAIEEKESDVDTLIGRGQSLLGDLEHVAADGTEWRPVKNVCRDVVDLMIQLEESGEVSGMPSGITELDRLTTGFHPGDLIVVAARPSMGKTALALRFVEHAILVEEASVAFFSLEMPSQHLVLRMAASLAKTPLQAARAGKLDGDGLSRIVDAMSKLASTKLFLDDTPSQKTDTVLAKAMQIKRRHGLDLLVVDYLQLLQPNRRHENRTQEVSAISRDLKAMAKTLQVPVIALAQLNRELERRPNKRPVMSDLRDSGQIEQDSDLILFIYRDEVYHEDSEDQGIAELIIGKQRNGPLGTVKTAFLADYLRFENLAPEWMGDG